MDCFHWSSSKCPISAITQIIESSSTPDAATLTWVTNTRRELSSNGIVPARMRLSELGEVRIATIAGWSIRARLSSDPVVLVSNIVLALTSKSIKMRGIAHLDYIDARLINKLYYKFKD